jgi:ribosomal protein L37AE/L43A
MDAFPMIQQSMRCQSAFYSYYACPTCGHEATRQDNPSIFDCDWCDQKEVQPIWLEPKLVDGKIVVEKAEWSYIELMP